MYAIVNIAGQQFKVEKEQEVIVHRLEEEIGAEVEFNDVMLIDDEGKIVVGQPVIEGVSVTAKVLSHLKGDKVLIFKKRRRKGYQKASGHRQFLTKIQIENIGEKAAKDKAVEDEEVTGSEVEVVTESEAEIVTGSEVEVVTESEAEVVTDSEVEEITGSEVEEITDSEVKVVTDSEVKED